MCLACLTPAAGRRTPTAAFTELRAHTAYSFGDGAVSPEALGRRARALGYSHLGITDCADLGGLAKFAVEAMAPSKDDACPHEKEHDTSDCPICQRPVRPIVGAELVVDGKPAAFLAKNPIGYNSLAALVTLSRVGEWRAWEKTAQGKRRGRPHVTFEQVAAYSDGLHVLTGPASGALADRVAAGDEFGARRTLARWREVFYGHLSVEVQLHHTGGDESELAATLIDLAERQGVPWVVTQDPRYVDDRGRLVHDLLTALRYDLTVDQANSRGLLRPNGDWRLTPPHDLVRRWQGRTQGLTESLRIAEQCEPFTLDWMRPPLPDFRRVSGVGSRASGDNEYLRELTYVGARERWGEQLTYEQSTQIEHELRIIGNLGFAGFFLVMADAIRFARSRGILCQGRGSAANSAVAFCLRITAADPVKHGLLFERFLSEARLGGKAVEPPDIDVDFEHERREEVLDYMYEKYERAHAAITGVTQMYRAPNAVLDAMRALGYPVETAQALSKRLHHADPMAGAEAIRDELAARVGLKLDDTRGQTLLRALTGFDGLARMRSTHVGGFVLSARPLGDFLPVEQTTMGRTIIQFDKDDLDFINVPKFDFLGLGGLTMLRKGFDAIEARTGIRPELYKLPYDDKKTYDLIARGETIGMFQIESRAQIQSILHTKPELLYDIVVQVALIRPGPIQAKFVHPYTERRLGRQAVTYPHPLLEPILKRTQGIPIFQEQAMAISMALGGYDGARADALRRTMGNERKKGKLLAALKELKAAIMARASRGEIEITEPVVDQVCEDLVSFANYGFPESHAWSFALIAFATAWLKAHYPTEFLLGLLNAQPMGFYPISTLIHDARRHGVDVVPPCLSVGSWDCTIEGKAMRVGWRFVRGMGETTLDRLKNAWMERQFTSIADVVRRAKLDRGESLNLARAGAFSAWTEDRRHAAWEALRAAGDALPLAPASTGFHEPAPLDRDRLVLLDYYAVGLSLNGHPMEAGRERLRAAGAVSSADLESLPNGRTITVGGLVTIRQRPSTAGGTIFLLLEDEFGFINVVVPASLVPANEEVVKQALFVVVRGKLENDGATINVVGRQFKELEMEAIEHRSRNFH